MEVWLLETYYDEDEKFEEIVLRVPDTNILIGPDGFDLEVIDAIPYTKGFWDAVKTKRNYLLTYLGDL